MSFILALKLALVPALIGAVTLAGRRWGATVAGWLSAFPIVAGPILFFIALEQGAAFVARAAVGTLSAVLAILVFAISYAWAATRFGWSICLAAAFAAYFSAVALLEPCATRGVDRRAVGVRGSVDCAASVSDARPAASMQRRRAATTSICA